MVLIRTYESGDFTAVVDLVARFRVELARFKGREKEPNLDAARDELGCYISSKNVLYPTWVAISDDGKLIGYFVCKVSEDVVWAESMYVLPDHRREGIATALFEKGEKLAKQHGNETLYNWIHPNNDGIIRFLQQKGYTVLNLLEVRKQFKDEPIRTKVEINGQNYDY
jgi:GNAT superfamily N-acetyltransferase